MNYIRNVKGAVIQFLFISVPLFFILSIPFRALASVDAGLDALQNHEYSKAEKFFTEQADKGDAHAMYWLGNTYQLEGGSKVFEAGSILLEAAEMGDPWAMYRLSPSNTLSYCSFWPCDSKWQSKAIEKFKKLSAEGDGKATYALMKYKYRSMFYRFTHWIPGMGQDMLNEMALKSYHQGYKGAAIYLFNNLNDDDPNKLKYIKEVANGGFIPSYSWLGLYYVNSPNPDLGIKFYEKGMSKGEVEGLKELFAIYLEGFAQQKKNYEKAYLYGKIAILYGLDFNSYFEENGFKEDRLNTKVSPEMQVILDKKAKQFVAEHKPYYYYDEFSHPFDVGNK